MTPYYDDGEVVIYHADVRSLVDVGTVAAVATSPPYNVGVGYDVHDDTMPWEDYWRLVDSAAQFISLSLVDGGRVWVNVAPAVAEAPNPARHHSGRTSKARTSKARASLLVGWGNALTVHDLDPVDVVAWTSQRGSGTAWGSWQSPSAPNLRGDWEAVLLHCKGDWPRTPPPGLEGWKDELGGWPAHTSNVWQIRPESRDGHPAPYPAELAARCIRLSTWPGETVLDPFMGSGSTLVAAKQLGRKAVGVELSERYCEIAARRLSQGLLFGDGAA